MFWVFSLCELILASFFCPPFFIIEEDWGIISDGAKDLIRKMLAYEPKDRISATEAYAHPWILSNVNVEPLDDKMMKKLS